MRSSFIAAVALATGFVSVLIYNVGVSHALDIRQEAPASAGAIHATPTGVQFIVAEHHAAEPAPHAVEPVEVAERPPLPLPRPSFKKPAISTPSITYLR